MGAEEFLRQLKCFGYEVVERGQYAVFSFVVPLGTLIGQTISIALFAPADFPLTPPPGPHVSPHIGHPLGAVHASDLGPDWEYWSRPYPAWNQTDRSVRTYMGHIRELFAQR